MGRNKRKQSKSWVSLILALLIFVIIYFCEASGINLLPEMQENVQTTQTVLTEETQAENLNLQDENMHIVFWDVGQADCILVQNKRTDNAN